MIFYVVTPEYEVRVPLLDDGTGPYEFVADVLQIEADSPRDAISLGVREMLRKGRTRDFRWCHDRRSEGSSPYAGVRAIPCEDVH